MTVYESYVAFCNRVGTEPRDEQAWAEGRFDTTVMNPNPATGMYMSRGSKMVGKKLQELTARKR